MEDNRHHYGIREAKRNGYSYSPSFLLGDVTFRLAEEPKLEHGYVEVTFEVISANSQTIRVWYDAFYELLDLSEFDSLIKGGGLVNRDSLLEKVEIDMKKYFIKLLEQN